MVKTISAYQRKQSKANGLHNGTIIHEEYGSNGERHQLHIRPDTGELVIMNAWAAPDGECVSYESEVLRVVPKSGIKFALNKEYGIDGDGLLTDKIQPPR